MYVFENAVWLDKDDQCNSCEHYLRGQTCPLIEALGTGVAELTEEITVQNCGFYKEFTRHLRVVNQ